MAGGPTGRGGRARRHARSRRWERGRAGRGRHRAGPTGTERAGGDGDRCGSATAAHRGSAAPPPAPREPPTPRPAARPSAGIPVRHRSIAAIPRAAEASAGAAPGAAATAFPEERDGAGAMKEDSQHPVDLGEAPGPGRGLAMSETGAHLVGAGSRRSRGGSGVTTGPHRLSVPIRTGSQHRPVVTEVSAGGISVGITSGITGCPSSCLRDRLRHHQTRHPGRGGARGRGGGGGSGALWGAPEPPATCGTRRSLPG